MNIESRVLKQSNVNWRELKPIQGGAFKELSKASYAKLKQSIINNQFIAPFTVWEHKSELYTIDGVHRQKVLIELEKEGVKVADKLPAVFLDCKNRKEAAKLLLIYSSAYARTTDEGLYEFLNVEELNFDELKLEIDIPFINDDYFIDPSIFEPTNAEYQSKLDQKNKVKCPYCGKEFEPK